MEPALLSDEQLHLDRLPAAVRDELRGAMPLWFYVLCEADTSAPRPGRRAHRRGGARRAGRGRSALLPDEEPDWRPDLGDHGDFGIADLVRVAREDGSSGAQGEQPGAAPEP